MTKNITLILYCFLYWMLQLSLVNIDLIWLKKILYWLSLSVFVSYLYISYVFYKFNLVSIVAACSFVDLIQLDIIFSCFTIFLFTYILLERFFVKNAVILKTIVYNILYITFYFLKIYLV